MNDVKDADYYELDHEERTGQDDQYFTDDGGYYRIDPVTFEKRYFEFG